MSYNDVVFAERKGERERDVVGVILVGRRVVLMPSSERERANGNG